MKPFTHTLKTLFESDVRYVVPLYQRPYVWTREKHWEPLWEDITVVLEHYLQNGDDSSKSLSHFLGALVLDQEDTPPGHAVERLVIDGQQRLTTLQLLLAAATQSAATAGADREARLLTSLIRNNADLESGDRLFKVWPTNANREAFGLAMRTDVPRDEVVDDPTNSIQEAAIYFNEAIDEWVGDGEPSEKQKLERYEVLRIGLSELLNVVSINLEEADNAQVIFETLNARGTPLLAMDLVKNAAFYRATKQKVDVDKLHAEVWEPQLGNAYWRETQRQGRLNRPRAELFLMHWLAVELGRIIPATELFTEFRTHVLDAPNKPSVAELITRLNEDAAVYHSFDAQPPGSVEEQFFRHLDALDTTTVIPIALLLYRSADIKVSQRRRALRLLESWLVRRMICALTTKNYNRIAAELLSVVKANPGKPDEAIRDALLAYDAETNLWPGDQALKSALTGRDLYGYITQKRVRMLLSAIELKERKSNKVEDMYELPAKLTIEHIMPMKWKRNWPLPSGKPEEAAIEARTHRLNQIGNLTLTSGPLNSSLSNGRWERKRKGLKDNSLLLLNRSVEENRNWDERRIDARTKELFSDIKALWPGPASSRWN